MFTGDSFLKYWCSKIRNIDYEVLLVLSYRLFSFISEIIKIFPFSKSSKPSLNSTKPPIQRVPWSFPEVKRPGHGVIHWTPYSAEAKSERSYTSSPPPLPFSFTEWTRTTLAFKNILWYSVRTQRTDVTMSGKLWIGKHLEGNGLGLTHVISRPLPVVTKENHRSFGKCSASVSEKIQTAHLPNSSLQLDLLYVSLLCRKLSFNK